MGASLREIYGGKGLIKVLEMTESFWDLSEQEEEERERSKGVLRDRFAQDGYLLLRGFLPQNEVLEARATILADLEANGFLETQTLQLEESSSKKESIGNQEGSENEVGENSWALARDSSVSPGLLARQDLASNDKVKRVLEHRRLFEFFDWFFGKPAMAIEYKWLRAVAKGLFTGVHVDRVYVG